MIGWMIDLAHSAEVCAHGARLSYRALARRDRAAQRVLVLLDRKSVV